MKPKILIVDDVPEMRQLLRSIVERTGFIACTAGTGRAAIETAFMIYPDLILLDVDLPDMDGWEVMRAVRESVSTKDIPIVFCSGSLEARDRFYADPPFKSSFILKPFSEDTIIDVLSLIQKRLIWNEESTKEPNVGRYI